MASKKKIKLVQELTLDIQNYPIVGLLNFETLPSRQLQKMRSALAQKGVKMRMARKKLLELALQNVKKPNLDAFQKKIKGMPALLFTKENPFVLYATIQRSKSPAFAKPGQEAPRDLMVKAGPTQFAPGPVISELASVGIKTKVEGGKLTIISDTIIAKEGTIISQKVCDTLKRLDIKPMEIGLNLVAVWENGLVFDAKQLHIDPVEYQQKVLDAARWAMNLAVEAGYASPETMELLLQKAFNDAKALSIEQSILTDLTVGDILAKVEREAHALQHASGFNTDEKPTEG
ncbi:MAG: 50S ribosomal protein L10 [Nanoarchaeota archaeon]